MKKGRLKISLAYISFFVACCFPNYKPVYAAHESSTTITMTDQGFSPSRLDVQNETPVHLHIINEGRRWHQFSIPKFRIYTRNLEPGATSDVEFTPSSSGQFVIMSDPSGNDNPEFYGKITVNPQIRK